MRAGGGGSAGLGGWGWRWGCQQWQHLAEKQPWSRPWSGHEHGAVPLDLWQRHRPRLTDVFKSVFKYRVKTWEVVTFLPRPDRHFFLNFSFLNFCSVPRSSPNFWTSTSDFRSYFILTPTLTTFNESLLICSSLPLATGTVCQELPPPPHTPHPPPSLCVFLMPSFPNPFIVYRLLLLLFGD